MSKVKKVLAMILALAMVMGMTLTTFAAVGTEDGSSITINGLTEGTNTTVKIYEVVKATPTAYNQWEVAKWVPQDAIISTTNPWQIDMDKLGIPADTAKVAEEVVQGTSHTFSGLDMGVYLVVATDADQTLVYKNMLVQTFTYDENGLLTNKAETATAKSQPNEITKTRTENSGNANDGVVEVGDTITYTITATIPNKRAAEGVFWISDTLTGATYNKDAKYQVNGGEWVSINDANNIKEDGETFRYSLANLLTDTNEGLLVKLEYTATVNAGQDEVKNSAQASNNPNRPSVTDVTSNFVLTKKETGKEDTTLANAQFKVFKVKDDAAVYAIANDQGYLTGWTNDVEQATSFTTGTDGTFTLKGLNIGTYYAVETVAPQGYSVANPYTEETTETEYAATGTISKAGETVTAGAMTAYDTKLSNLPETGGIGTTIFTIGGCVIMIAAAGLFFASRRKSAEK